MPTPSVVSKFHPLKQYKWGDNSEAWELLNDKDLSFKLERMGSGMEEVLHYHKVSRQFFFVTRGRGFFEVDDIILIVHEGEGLLIESGRKHRVINKEQSYLEFIVCSQPSIADDRYNIT
jgi:mannose-6-phosphate isomerase-like protein (cupin superfamily)